MLTATLCSESGSKTPLQVDKLKSVVIHVSVDVVVGNRLKESVYEVFEILVCCK